MSLFYKVLKKPVTLEDLADKLIRLDQHSANIVIETRSVTNFDPIDPVGSKLLREVRVKAKGIDFKVAGEDIPFIPDAGAFMLSNQLIEGISAENALKAAASLQEHGINTSINGKPADEFIQELRERHGKER